MESETEVTPKVSVEFKPQVGLEFDSLDSAEKFLGSLLKNFKVRRCAQGYNYDAFSLSLLTAKFASNSESSIQLSINTKITLHLNEKSLKTQPKIKYSR